MRQLFSSCPVRYLNDCSMLKETLKLCDSHGIEFKLAVQAAHPTVRTKNKLLSVDQMVTLILKQKSLNMSIYQQERLTDSHDFGNELMFN